MTLPPSLRRTVATMAAAVLAAGVVAFGTATADARTTYPVTSNLVTAAVKALADPSAPPAGANIRGCRVTSAHPRPVVLVNGTFANQIDAWAGLAPTLANLGYCVYTTVLGAAASSLVQTTGPVAASVQQLSNFVNGVLATTGASQVDLVGHSQGGMLAEYYVKVLNGASKVHSIVGLSPTTHGTSLDGLALLAGFFPGANHIVRAACAACADQEVGSSVIRTLDSGPIAKAGVTYTIIETLNETVVTPVGSAFIHEPGVKNLYLQSVCPFNWTDHVDLTYDRGVWSLVENALDPAHPSAVSCY